jgi:hypothetical protein
MYEGATEKKISFIHRVKVALEWAIKYFAMMVTMIFVAAMAIVVLLLIVDKLKIINAITNKIEE